MGNMFQLINVFAVVLFALLIYLLTKLIIEKNEHSISMVKILGYENDDDKRSFEFLAELTGETETRYYRNHVYNYLNPDQED